MSISKQEQRLYEVIKSIYPHTIEQSYRPNFLKNERTGSNYEIDIFIQKYRIGFEYQGAVHFKKISRYNNNPDKARYNDMDKHSIVLKHQSYISIVEVFETDLTGNIKDNIINRCMNTQLYYFRQDLYRKCYMLERFIQNVKDEDDNIKKTWFDLIARVRFWKSEKLPNRKSAVGNLIGFYFTNYDKIPHENEMYDLAAISKRNHFDQALISYLKKKAA